MSAQAIGIGMIVVAAMVGLGFLSYVKYEPVGTSASFETGIVLRHVRGSSGKSSPNPYFIVKLPDGREIRVRDSGEYPVTYRGSVKVSSGEGVTTGRRVYTFVR